MRRHLTPRRIAATTIVAGAGMAIALPAIAATTGGSGTAGGAGSARTSELQAYYPKVITIHAGETVRFSIQGFHTVTFVPNGRPAPQLIVPTGQNAPAQNDPAGQPYWWVAAGVPQFALNPAALAPSRSNVVTARRIVNSGAPQGRNPSATFRFPAPGVYRYRCLPHPNMTGVVRVLPARARVDHAAQARRARAERNADLAAERRTRTAAERRRGGTTVLVGVGTRRFHAFGFYPRALSVKAGTVVTFRWGGKSEVHSVTFGPKAETDRLIRAFETSQAIPGEVQYSSDPPGAPPAVTASAHGNGLVNSGLLFDPGAGPPGVPSSFQAVFPAPGVYEYVCIVHGTIMKGTITVTP